jgi:hypothetical protein
MGVLVYETKGYNNTSNAFEGISAGRSTIQQSTGLPTGTYFYILSYTSLDGTGQTITNKKRRIFILIQINNLIPEDILRYFIKKTISSYKKSN